MRLCTLLIAGLLSIITGAATADQPPALNAWATVRIEMRAEEDYAKARRAIFEVMNRHDFDFRGEGTDRLTFNRGRRWEERTAPAAVPTTDLFGHDQIFTQIAFDYVPDWRARELTIVARPVRYGISYSTRVTLEKTTYVTEVEDLEMKAAPYTRVLQRELDLIKARMENPARPIVYDRIFP